MHPKKIEQTVTMIGPPRGGRVAIQEHNGGSPGAVCNSDSYWLQGAGGEKPDVSLAVAQEALRLYKAGQKQVVVTVEGGLGVAIRGA